MEEQDVGGDPHTYKTISFENDNNKGKRKINHQLPTL